MRGRRRGARAVHPHRGLLYVLFAAVLALTGCTGGDQDRSGAQRTPGPTDGVTGAAAGSYDRIPDIVDRAKPSVVTIRTGNGVGSGVIYRSNGVIVTNAHVVARGQQARSYVDEVTVVFATGKRTTGRVVGTDYRTDLAVIRVDRSGLRAAEFQTDLPEVGQLAVAIGSPLGFTESVTAGIISGVNRTFPIERTQRPLVNLIQTDAAISPGSSGGALVNEDGEVVGISELYVPPERGAESLGFAIPSATVTDVVNQLLETGDVQHAFFGAEVAPVTPRVADQLGLEQASGVLVREVTSGSGAAQAGIQGGDVIVAVDGNDVGTIEQFLAMLRRHQPGDTITVTLAREGERQQVDVTLSDRPEAS